MRKKLANFKKSLHKFYTAIREFEQVPFNGLLPVTPWSEDARPSRKNKVSVEDLRPQKPASE